MAPSSRRYDLDWLRVLAMLAVFAFHCARFFDSGGWHVKNASSYFAADVFTNTLGLWIMPVRFMISGASTWYALGTRGEGKFARDRFLRLIVPLLLGVFLTVPPQVYLERITHFQYGGTFWQFYTGAYFHGWYGFGGNFAWMGLHLWYLLILFVFSLLLLPVFMGLKSERARTLRNALAGFFAKPGMIYLPVLLLSLPQALLNPKGILGMRDFGGWNLPVYLLVFLLGFLFFSDERYREAIQRQRGVSLGIGGLALLGLFAYVSTRDWPSYGTPLYAAIAILMVLASWAGLMTFLGYGTKQLNFTNPFLKYASEAVMPFYVLHQSIILHIGFFVVGWNLHPLLKYALIAASSFAAILALYEFVVRRVNLLRFLFGMKPLKRPAARLQPAASQAD